MAQYNIQDLPDDDSLSQSNSNIIRAAVPPQVSNSQQYGVFVPQVIQPQIQTNYPQQGPLPCYVQYIPQQPQQPVHPQQVYHHQQVRVQPDRNIAQPLIVNPPAIVLNHTLVHQAGNAEQIYFHTRTLGQFALTNLLTIIVISISTLQPVRYCGITFNIYQGTFTPTFYISIALFILTTLITVSNYKKQLNIRHQYWLAILWNITYILIFQGSFASSYRTYQWGHYWEYSVYRVYFGDEMLYGLILVLVQLLSIIIALNNEKQVSYQKFSAYIITSAALFELAIYNFTDLDDELFYWISFISSVWASYYFISIIKQINKTGLLFYKKKTNDTIVAPILWLTTVLFPFYVNEE